MCLIDFNIIKVENKEVRRISDITYEERVKIEIYVEEKTHNARGGIRISKK